MPSPDDKDNGEGEQSSPDWGEVFGDLVCHTSITHSEIPYMTIPQIEAYRKSIGKNIPLKIGIPGMFSGASSLPSSTLQRTDKPPKLSQFISFANAFNEI